MEYEYIYQNLTWDMKQPGPEWRLHMVIDNNIVVWEKITDTKEVTITGDYVDVMSVGRTKEV